jgi:CHAD domain-containing protein
MTGSLSKALRDHAIAQLVTMEQQLHRRAPYLHAGIHEARKAARRCRSVLSLCSVKSTEPGTEVDKAIKHLCKRLSPLRDAQVVAEKASAKRGKARQAATLDTLRRSLKARRDALVREAMRTDPAFRRERRMIQGARRQLAALVWKACSPEAVLHNLSRSAGKVRRAERKAKGQRSAGREHRWRRRVRRLKLQLQALQTLADNAQLALEAREQASWVLGQAAEAMPGLRELNSVGDRLGERRDRKLLAKAVRSEFESPLREDILEVLSRSAKKG